MGAIPVESVPDFRKLATEWVTEYRRRGAAIEDAAVPGWIDRVEYLFRESWAARRVQLRIARQLGGAIKSLDEVMGRIREAADRTDGG
jgi:hypothetical protein